MVHKPFRSAEHVSEGHPDKFCDQVADEILDDVLRLCDGQRDLAMARTAVECLAKDKLLVLSGEVNLPPEVSAGLDPVAAARRIWRDAGYGEDPSDLTVVNHLRHQSPDIAMATDHDTAGDQGIMVGYATDETEQMMPTEWVKARDLCLRMSQLRGSEQTPWLRSDCKSQVTIGLDRRITSVIVAAQHADEAKAEEVFDGIYRHVVKPICPEVVPEQVTVNGTGRFVIGGPEGDAGVVGRKIVVDAYGPRIPVGGGAYSGKDPTKVDRSAAYMARHIAKTVVAHKIGGVRECTVFLAYGIGQHQPQLVSAVGDGSKDLSQWVREHFADLSPGHIIEYLGLRRLNGWSYRKTSTFGHYGREHFPWEHIANL